MNFYCVCILFVFVFVLNYSSGLNFHCICIVLICICIELPPMVFPWIIDQRELRSTKPRPRATTCAHALNGTSQAHTISMYLSVFSLYLSVFVLYLCCTTCAHALNGTSQAHFNQLYLCCIFNVFVCICVVFVLYYLCSRAQWDVLSSQ